MTTAINYKGRVWTCDFHNTKIETMLAEGKTKEAKSLVNLVHPKKGNHCAECARLYDETPPANR